MPQNQALAYRAIRGLRKFVSEGPYVRDSAHPLGRRFPCFYCPHILDTESGRIRHILFTSDCRRVDQLEGLSSANGNQLLTQVLEPARPDPPLTGLPLKTKPKPTNCNTSDQLPLKPSTKPDVPLPPLLPQNDNAPRIVFDERRCVFVELFPDPRAGAPINDQVVQPLNLEVCLIQAGSLGDPDYFDTAELLMTTGLTNAGRDVHLKSRLYQGNVPWPNNKQLMADIDKLPHGPEWMVFNIRLNETGQHACRKHDSYLFLRCVLAAFRELMANPEFNAHMQYAAHRDWTAEDWKCRVYGESCSGDWWWELQEQISDKYATIVPLFISYDRTKLSVMSGGQTAYPVYLTLGNIDKSVRRRLRSRATILLAYLPVDKFANVGNDVERSRLRRELIHRALEKVFEPLKIASEQGLVVVCPDGRYRRAYPTLAGVMLDYEEQAQSTGIMKDRCAKCLKSGDSNGKLGPPRSSQGTLTALRAWLEGEGRGLAAELELRDKPVWLWWANIPNFDFSASLVLDILHQLHQGMTRHLLKWSVDAAGRKRVDRGFMLMPSAEGMRHFSQGVSRLSQWTGRESKEAAKQLLPIIACLDGKHWNQNFIRLARAILDFTYRAQASRMTEDNLIRLEKTVQEIHKYKTVLVDMKVFQDDSRFDLIVKLHMLSHYSPDTRKMGTPDGFSTKTPEHCHIESKRAWRASNKVAPTPQMIKFIQRYEALRIHRARMNTYLGIVESDGGSKQKSHVVYDEDEDTLFYPTRGVVGTQETGGPQSSGGGGTSGVVVDLGDRLDQEEEDGNQEEGEDKEQTHIPGRMRTAADARRHVVYPNPTLSIALKPTCGRVRGLDIIANHGATDFVSALHAFLNKHGSRELPSFFLPTPYHEYPVWHRLYLRHDPLPFDPEWPRRDVIRARPANGDQEGVFDVALALIYPERPGLHRYHAVRVRAIFALPRTFEDLYPHPLVYVELFTPFSHSISPYHAMHSLSQLRHLGKRRTAVMSALDLAAACHLAPNLRRPELDLVLSSGLYPDMLNSSLHFWLNHYYNRFIYRLIDHWRTAR